MYTYIVVYDIIIMLASYSIVYTYIRTQAGRMHYVIHKVKKSTAFHAGLSIATSVLRRISNYTLTDPCKVGPHVLGGTLNVLLWDLVYIYILALWCQNCLYWMQIHTLLPFTADYKYTHMNMYNVAIIYREHTTL